MYQLQQHRAAMDRDKCMILALAGINSIDHVQGHQNQLRYLVEAEIWFDKKTEKINFDIAVDAFLQIVQHFKQFSVCINQLKGV